MADLNKIIHMISRYRKSPYFGFIRGHDYITENDIMYLEKFIEKPQYEIVEEFEKKFASIIGDGQAVSFAAGRMGFYILMNILGIGQGDEIILQAMNCGVMVNAILRVGAKPVFADIDPETFGSSAKQIEKLITDKTKMIIAQHTFGIPCNIEPIIELARSYKIFLLEDSALTLGSKINGIPVGNFGDAALFSLDHTKPLNALIGGFIYSKNPILIKKLKKIQRKLPELPLWKQRALWRRFLFERKYYNPPSYGRAGIIDMYFSVKFRLFKRKNPFLSDDVGLIRDTSYPYPSRLPSFLAVLGLFEISKWPEYISSRKEMLIKLLGLSMVSETKTYLPASYLNKNLDIVPLRFIWSQPKGNILRKLISSFIDTDWTLFIRPISTTLRSLELLGYKKGTCPVAEKLCEGMINIPCNLINNQEIEKIIEMLHSVLSAKN